MFDTLIVFLKNFFEKQILKKKHQSMKIFLPRMQRVKAISSNIYLECTITTHSFFLMDFRIQINTIMINYYVF